MLRASEKKEKCITILLAAVLSSTILLAAQAQVASALVNGLPVLDPIPDQMVDELSTLTFNVTASDPDGQPLTFSMQNAPYGATLDAATGIFVWTPREEQGSGIYRIDIVVSDGLVITSQDVLIIVNDVGGGGDGNGRRASLSQEEPKLGSSQQGVTDLIADPASIPLDATTSLIQESDPVNNGTLMSLTVQEPDGDVCVAEGLTIDIPADGIGKVYPDDFGLATEAGDGICDTSHLGTYVAQSEVATNSGIVLDSAQFVTESPFVLPESPVGLIALLGSSLAALGGFMVIRGRASR